eukprot:7107725-Ditylum_brightwellii.AAC.1
MGMTLDFTEKGKVKVLMVGFVKTSIEQLPEAIERMVSSPGANHLFMVNEECKISEGADYSHHYDHKDKILTQRQLEETPE